MSLSESTYFGYLTFEEQPGSGVFVRRFFVLDRTTARLEYYIDANGWVDRQSAKTDTDRCLGHFNTRYISFVSESSSSKKKFSHCFVIVISGDRCLFGADSEQEKANWIHVLQDASRISVPEDPDVVLTPQRNGCQIEIIGGVVHATSLQDVPHSASVKSSVIRQRSATSNKEGYCVKQGAVRKNWKRRYFMLDTFALSYYSSQQDKCPKRSIHVKDIIEARISVGIHPHKQNVFEIVTPLRVFYIQAETLDERDSWITAVNDMVKVIAAPKLSDPADSDL